MSYNKKSWINYCKKELEDVTPILSSYGFNLEDDQPHLKGERYLQQAVSTDSGKKLILIGKNNEGEKVVIKTTRDPYGKAELRRERDCRKVLNDIDFAGEVFNTPKEVLYVEEKGFSISIQSFIEQETTFLERPIEKQFELSLSAFKAQESAHATTYKHRKLIARTYDIRDGLSYLKNFNKYLKEINNTFNNDEDIDNQLAQANEFLKENINTINQYGGFLTHTDFVPHNFRIKNDKIYLLDHSSLTFGNKHEGWARFLNFMTLYNQPLERAFIEYTKNNRAHEEQLSLKLMRVYRLGEIMCYYTDKLPQSEGNLLKLNTARVYFWNTVLSSIMEDNPVSEDTIKKYQEERDSLRSEDEKERQRGLH